MADVIITPASGLIDFQNTSGISSATIQLDGNGNLSINAAAGNIEIGDTASDIFIGDGVANVDIVFEEDGEIRGLTGKTITLGQSDSFIAFAGDITGDVDFTGGLNVSGVSTFQGNVNLGDNDKIRLGDGGDLEIFYNGTNSIIKQVTAGDLVLQSDDDIAIQVAGTENAIVCNGNGAVDIRYNNIKKFETTGAGVTITGIATATTFYAPGGSFNPGSGTIPDASIVIEDDSAIYTRDGGIYLRNLIQKKSDVIIIGQQNTTFTDGIELKAGGAGSVVKLHHGGSGDNVKLQTTTNGIEVTGTTDTDQLNVTGVSTFQGGIHDGTSLGTSGQVLSSTGTGLSWIDAAAGGGGGGSGTFDTGITTSIYVAVNSGVGTNVSETNDVFIGPDTSYTFPSTAGKKYVIESIHFTNTFNNEIYLTARHDFNGGSNVPIAQRVIVPYQGATEFLDQPIIANPSDVFKFQALDGTDSAATGINGGLDAFIVYSTKDDTDYIGTGKTVTTAAGTEIFQATSNPAMLQSIKLCNYSLNSDIDASISIYNDGLSSGVRLGYLVYNLTVPKNSVIEILEKPKYLTTNAAIVAGASAANVLGVTIAGKYIT